MILAIDFGFGNVKAVTEEGNKYIFKSAFCKNNHKWLCGNEALATGIGVTQPTTIESLIELYPIVINACMEYFGIEHPDTIAVGLPLESAEYLSVQVKDVLGKKYNVSILVYPQAASIAWMTEIQDVLVIDIGFNTVITCVVQEKKITYAKTNYGRGAVSIAKKLEKELRARLALSGKSFSTIELDYILNRGRLQNGFDVLDVRDRAEELRKEYIYETVKTAVQDLKVNLSSVVNFDAIIIAGGLAKDVRIDSSRIKIIPLEDPIFANVEAFLARAMEGKNEV